MKQQQTDACLMASCDAVNSNSVPSSVLNAKQKIYKFIQITIVLLATKIKTVYPNKIHPVHK